VDDTGLVQTDSSCQGSEQYMLKLTIRTFGRLKPEVYSTVLEHTAELDCQNGMCLPVDPSKSLHRPWRTAISAFLGEKPEIFRGAGFVPNLSHSLSQFY